MTCLNRSPTRPIGASSRRKTSHIGRSASLLIVAAALALMGCPRPPITPHQRSEIGRVEQAWHEAGLPDPGDCLDGARVLYTDRSDFRDRCRAGRASDTSDECLGQYSRGMFGRRSGWLVLIVDGSQTAERDVRHSLLHGLVDCTLDRPVTDPYDGNHTDLRVWEFGGPTSAEQRARPD